MRSYGSGRTATSRAETAGPPRWIIATAIPEEFEAIAKRVEGRLAPGGEKKEKKEKKENLLRGRIQKASVTLVLTGDGPVNAGRELGTFLRSEYGEGGGGAGRLDTGANGVVVIGLGVAGALSRELRRGDLLVGQRLFDESGEAPRPDRSLIDRAVAAGAREALFATVAKPFVSVEGKTKLAASLLYSPSKKSSGGALSGSLPYSPSKQIPGGALSARDSRSSPLSLPAAVDMESAAWARVAAAAGAPFLVVRAITDTLEEELPAFLAECMGEDGGISRAAVAARLLTNPGALPRLLQMRRRVSEAAEHLADFAVRLLSREA